MYWLWLPLEPHSLDFPLKIIRASVCWEDHILPALFLRLYSSLSVVATPSLKTDIVLQTQLATFMMRWSYESGRLLNRSSTRSFFSMLCSIADNWENRVFRVLMCSVIEVDSDIWRPYSLLFTKILLCSNLALYGFFKVSQISFVVFNYEMLTIYYLLLLNTSLRQTSSSICSHFCLEHFLAFHQLLLGNFPVLRWLSFFTAQNCLHWTFPFQIWPLFVSLLQWTVTHNSNKYLC